MAINFDDLGLNNEPIRLNSDAAGLSSGWKPSSLVSSVPQLKLENSTYPTFAPVTLKSSPVYQEKVNLGGEIGQGVGFGLGSLQTSPSQGSSATNFWTDLLKNTASGLLNIGSNVLLTRAGVNQNSGTQGSSTATQTDKGQTVSQGDKGASPVVAYLPNSNGGDPLQSSASGFMNSILSLFQAKNMPQSEGNGGTQGGVNWMNIALIIAVIVVVVLLLRKGK